jgi:hypothetical protein
MWMQPEPATTAVCQKDASGIDQIGPNQATNNISTISLRVIWLIGLESTFMKVNI